MKSVLPEAILFPFVQKQSKRPKAKPVRYLVLDPCIYDVKDFVKCFSQCADVTCVIVDVFICNVPVKDTARILGAIKSISGQNTLDLHHLRRVVKHEYRPEWLQQREIQQSQNEISVLYHDTETVHIFLAPVCLISRLDLSSLLQKHLPNIFTSPVSDSNVSLCETTNRGQILDTILTAPVPLYPPTSASHALIQSKTLWPTTYNPNTIYGPNLADLTTAQHETERNAGTYIDLAKEAAREAHELGRGECVGVVIVESLKDAVEGRDGALNENPKLDKNNLQQENIVCVAGDARFIKTGSQDDHSSHEETISAKHTPSGPPKHNDHRTRKGDPANHAIMRAIAMVAHKRRALLHEASSSPPSPKNPATGSSGPAIDTSPGLDPPPSPLEQPYLEADSLQPNGYLCLNLHIYTTHEPCVMCSMALVHSRVGRVVFAKRMAKTGGLCSETGISEQAFERSGSANPDSALESQKSLGYGLFWRTELNWRFMCWQWRDGQDSGDDEHESDVSLVSDRLHADVHA